MTSVHHTVFYSAAYKITEIAYAIEKMTSTLVIKKVTSDEPLICSTNILFKFSTPATQIDAYGLCYLPACS